jgi:phosphatidylinositol-4,5-bisphosphate 4-phosphatase
LLAQAGFTSKQIDKLTNKKALRKAQLNALSVSPTWQTVERDMLIVRDGAVQSYKSKIKPAQHLNQRFKESYTVDGQVCGVTAGEANQPNHARNLKLSELFNAAGDRLAAVLGHGVLDMWKITDPELRKKANTGAAKEVLELAVASNGRLSNTIDRARAADEPIKPLRVTHISVNLISPDNLRSTALFNALKSDYAEKTTRSGSSTRSKPIPGRDNNCK